MQRLRRAYHKLDNIFTDQEAWSLFKAAAVLETIGWAGLIIAIITKVKGMPEAQGYIAIAGGFHGTFYLFYTAIIIFGHRAMKWSIWKFLWAAGLSNIPFGALVFELWVSRQRSHKQVATQYATTFYYCQTQLLTVG